MPAIVPLSRLHELERFEAAFTATTDGLHQRDLTTGKVYRSPQWKAILGYADDEWDESADWADLLHPADAGAVQKQRAEFVSGQREQFGAEFRLRRRDGDYVWVRAQARLTRHPDGTPLYVTGVFTDITRERRLAEEREETVRALRRSQDNLRYVMQMANCLLWQAIVRETPAPPGSVGRFDAERGTDLAWTFEMVNDPDEDSWLPLDRRNNESMADAWFRVRDREDGRAGFRRLRQALRDGEDRYTHLYGTTVADGSVRCLLEDVRIEGISIGGEKMPLPGIDADNRLRRWRLVAVATDVTERKYAEELLTVAGAELERSNEALRRSNEAMSEFVSAASHDLKEPLRKIQTFGGMLQRKTADTLSPDAAGYVERMIAAATRMQALIDGLLHLARTSQRPIVLDNVDLNQIARDVQADLEVRIAEAQGRVYIDHLPTIAADPLQMRQLFQNLMGNALKFHRADTPPVVRVCVAPGENSALILTFTDNGVGFSPDHAERIFKVFERLEKTEARFEGSGVGLAICRKIVERHGGTIRAESRPGEGAAFVITLPRNIVLSETLI